MDSTLTSYDQGAADIVEDIPPSKSTDPSTRSVLRKSTDKLNDCSFASEKTLDSSFASAVSRLKSTDDTYTTADFESAGEEDLEISTFGNSDPWFESLEYDTGNIAAQSPNSFHQDHDADLTLQSHSFHSTPTNSTDCSVLERDIPGITPVKTPRLKKHSPEKSLKLNHALSNKNLSKNDCDILSCDSVSSDSVDPLTREEVLSPIPTLVPNFNITITTRRSLTPKRDWSDKENVSPIVTKRNSLGEIKSALLEDKNILNASNEKTVTKPNNEKEKPVLNCRDKNYKDVGGNTELLPVIKSVDNHLLELCESNEVHEKKPINVEHHTGSVQLDISTSEASISGINSLSLVSTDETDKSLSTDKTVINSLLDRTNSELVSSLVEKADEVSLKSNHIIHNHSSTEELKETGQGRDTSLTCTLLDAAAETNNILNVQHVNIDKSSSLPIHNNTEKLIDISAADARYSFYVDTPSKVYDSHPIESTDIFLEFKEEDKSVENSETISFKKELDEIEIKPGTKLLETKQHSFSLDPLYKTSCETFLTENPPQTSNDLNSVNSFDPSLKDSESDKFYLDETVSKSCNSETISFPGVTPILNKTHSKEEVIKQADSFENCFGSTKLEEKEDSPLKYTTELVEFKETTHQSFTGLVEVELKTQQTAGLLEIELSPKNAAGLKEVEAGPVQLSEFVKVQVSPERTTILEEVQAEPVQTSGFVKVEVSPEKTTLLEEVQVEPVQTSGFVKVQVSPERTLLLEEVQADPLQPSRFVKVQVSPEKTTLLEEVQADPLQPSGFVKVQVSPEKTTQLEEVQVESVQTSGFVKVQVSPEKTTLLEEVQSDPLQPSGFVKVQDSPEKTTQLEEVQVESVQQSSGFVKVQDCPEVVVRSDEVQTSSEEITGLLVVEANPQQPSDVLVSPLHTTELVELDASPKQTSGSIEVEVIPDLKTTGLVEVSVNLQEITTLKEFEVSSEQITELDKVQANPVQSSGVLNFQVSSVGTTGLEEVKENPQQTTGLVEVEVSLEQVPGLGEVEGDSELAHSGFVEADLKTDRKTTELFNIEVCPKQKAELVAVELSSEQPSGLVAVDVSSDQTVIELVDLGISPLKTTKGLEEIDNTSPPQISTEIVKGEVSPQLTIKALDVEQLTGLSKIEDISEQINKLEYCVQNTNKDADLDIVESSCTIDTVLSTKVSLEGKADKIHIVDQLLNLSSNEVISEDISKVALDLNSLHLESPGNTKSDKKSEFLKPSDIFITNTPVFNYEGDIEDVVSNRGNHQSLIFGTDSFLEVVQPSLSQEYTETEGHYITSVREAKLLEFSITEDQPLVPVQENHLTESGKVEHLCDKFSKKTHLLDLSKTDELPPGPINKGLLLELSNAEESLGRPETSGSSFEEAEITVKENQIQLSSQQKNCDMSEHELSLCDESLKDPVSVDKSLDSLVSGFGGMNINSTFRVNKTLPLDDLEQGEYDVPDCVSDVSSDPDHLENTTMPEDELTGLLDYGPKPSVKSQSQDYPSNVTSDFSLEMKPLDLNTTEAGPVTAGDDIQAGELNQVISDADVDISALKRKVDQNADNSLIKNFDPLTDLPTSNHLNDSIFGNVKESGDVEVEVTPIKDHHVGLLIPITPVPESAPSTPKRNKSQSTTAHTTPVKAPGTFSTPSTSRLAAPGHHDEVLSPVQVAIAKELSKFQEAFKERMRIHEDRKKEVLQKITEAHRRKERNMAVLKKLGEKRPHIQKLEKAKVVNAQLKETWEEAERKSTELLGVIGGYEKTLRDVLNRNEAEKNILEAEVKILLSERNTAQQHVANMETALNDIHAKYERSVKVVDELMNSQGKKVELLRGRCKELEVAKQKYLKLLGHATQRLEETNKEKGILVRSHSGELERMRGLIDQKELKIKSNELAYRQKEKELRDLRKIYEDLLSKLS